MGERTGSRVLQWVWSYVVEKRDGIVHIGGRRLGYRKRSRQPSRWLRTRESRKETL
ncbi:hypothetical protein CCHR01_10700 [Colletotrichum chrysophilum]|uniref:Uncharacterized protein n=1 Tax=Colletotrichum chrysophilum TaxID=1836956 RepID=A0AAD9EGI9_9PEZI|nr:hypothetical protein CCHR01_10700 [Colletotrichum chrysophilum]